MTSKAAAKATELPVSGPGETKHVIFKFVARRTLRSATFAALVFGLFAAAKIIGYADVYPTAKERSAAGALLAGNAGFTAIFGSPYHLETVAGYAVWYALGVGVLLGGIWAYLVATKTFRGEETAGRWEPLLMGQTTLARATAAALAGLGVSVGLFFAVAAVILVAIGRAKGVNITAGPALYLALASVAAAALFMAVGAFTSQVMPTRARAAGLATAIFGICFLLRAAGDITSAHWLTDISPLGWVEKLHPLLSPQPLWLVPIVAFIIALSAATVYLAGHRDLGASLIHDSDEARPRTFLLRGPLTGAIRLTRASSVAWVAAFAVFAVFFGTLTNTAAQAFESSASALHMIDRLAGVARESGAKAFLGITFLIIILLLMSYAATAVGAIRQDEANGYTDNLLVQPVSRSRLLWGRIGLIVAVILVSGFVSCVVVWLTLGRHTNGLSFNDLWLAGVNSLPPAILTLGAGVFALGVIPRYTTIVAYAVVAWSFLVQMVSSGLNLNHWVLDTSVFYHVALAPAASPKWGSDLVITVIGLGLCVVGAAAFNRRDMAGE